ncbi:WD40/YVTN/BNR-like repeat-containing protein [Engelhardtia mirabilis]|uniref:BNR/Asp-box repeat protein n=1 Tax=Engelhardtia mirabilis TaxID=2528011 RepID=A0A518BJG5_9BACT|nr:BNR/Asp-box repeat protein [Planctomycetes bacterium Pla133]QDV01422.1 BNR/Asp-box repeat protein [Planctomycetes bacterium Pla86]
MQRSPRSFAVAAASILCPLLVLACAASPAAAPAPSAPAAGVDASGAVTSEQRADAEPSSSIAPPLPMPTENWLDDRAEGRQSSLRKAWIRERHWAGPGVDWNELERRNGDRLRQRGNQLVTMAAAAPPWTERGSRNQAGRVHVAAHSPDGQALYVGSAKGGLWHGTLDGTGWEPIGDDLYGGAHWLAVLPHPAGGAAPAVLRATDGGSIHLSLDDGATWFEPTGIPQSSGIRRVIRGAGPAPAVFVVGRKSGSGGVGWAVYRSTDSGQSFTKVRDLGSYAGDLWTSRQVPADLLYLVDGNQCFVSADQGDSWSLRGTLPSVGSGQAELVGSEAGAPRLWAVQHTGSGELLRRSDDAGQSWTAIQTLSDYWGTLNASIVDADLFAWGGVECHRTTNGGASFKVVNGWGEYYGNPAGKLHADLPGMDVWPDGAGGEVWYVCTDGGLFRSTDGLSTVANLSLDGLGISQYYTTLTSAANPDHVVAGSQDQGWQRADAPPAAGTELLAFDQSISGDYGHAVSGDGTHDFVFTVYPGFVLISRGEDNPSLYTEDFPAGEAYSWMPSLTADPLRKDYFFLCATHLWHYTRVPGTNDWTASQYSNQNFALSSGEYLTGLAFSPVDGDRAFAVTNKGRFWASNDRGVTWAQGSGSGPGPQYFYGTAILASSTDVDTAWVGGSGYSGPGVWRTTDGGLSWQAWSTGLPSTLVYCLGEAPDGSGTVFAGTEMEVFRRDPGGAWYDISGGTAPAVPYWSVEALPDGQTMRFGTYGRGIWDYEIEPPCNYVAFGVGLGGVNDLVLDSASTTAIGQTHVFSVAGAPPFTLGILGLATASAAVPLFGGTVLIDPGGVTPLYFNTLAGTGAVSVQVPNDTGLVGATFFLQAVVIGPQPGEVHLSNGLSGTLCF